MTSGVPQGSVLGPILFLIYINDIPDKTRSKIRLFADDTAIYLAVSNLQDSQILQQDLDHLHEWELQWDMEFNPSKCGVIHITQDRTPDSSEYLLHGHILESVGGSKYLGVEICDNLSFNNHIQKYAQQPAGPWDSLRATSGRNPQPSVKWHTRLWCAH